MAEYKGRRERKRAAGGTAGDGHASPPHGHMVVMIALAPGKKSKKPDHVEGASAKKHLGKRARGGYADGGAPGYDWSRTSISNRPPGSTLLASREPMAGRIPPTPPVSDRPQFGTITNEPIGQKTSRFASGDYGGGMSAKPENRGVTSENLAPAYPATNPQMGSRSGPPLGGPNPQIANRSAAPFRNGTSGPPPSTVSAASRPDASRPAPPSIQSNATPQSYMSADDLTAYWNGPAGDGSGMTRFEAHQAGRKRGGRTQRKAGGHVEGAAAHHHMGRRARGGRMLDAREASHDPDQDGLDKVSWGHGTDERAAEMPDREPPSGRGKRR